MIGIAPIAKRSSSVPVSRAHPGVACAVCACVLLTMAITLTATSRVGFANQHVEQMIAEYQSLRKNWRRANEIVEDYKNYSESEVQRAIFDRENMSNRLQILKNKILASGGKIPEKEKPPQEEQPDSGGVAGSGTDQEPVTDTELNLRVPAGGRIGAKQDGERTEIKAPTPRRPWKLGDWPWDFNPPSKFPALREKYYRLQEEMGALLLVRRKTWTRQQVFDYTEKLTTLCKQIVDIEEKIAFGLGDVRKFKRAIRQHKKIWNEYLAKQKVTDDAEAAYKKTEDEYYKLLKKSGLNPGDTVATDDPNARELNRLAIKHKMELEHFEKVQKISERAKTAPGIINRAREQRIKDGVALTIQKPPKLVIHRGCLGNQASFVYKMFLNEDEFQTFIDQSALRAQQSLR